MTTMRICSDQVTSGAPDVTWSEQMRMVVIYRFDALMVGMIAAWLSIRFERTWLRSAFLCALCGSILLIAMYATLWKIENGHLAFGDDNFLRERFGSRSSRSGSLCSFPGHQPG